MKMVHDSVLRFVSLNKILQECMQMIGDNVLRLGSLNNAFVMCKLSSHWKQAWNFYR